MTMITTSKTMMPPIIARRESLVPRDGTPSVHLRAVWQFGHSATSAVISALQDGNFKIAHFNSPDKLFVIGSQMTRIPLPRNRFADHPDLPG